MNKIMIGLSALALLTASSVFAQDGRGGHGAPRGGYGGAPRAGAPGGQGGYERGYGGPPGYGGGYGGEPRGAPQNGYAQGGYAREPGGYPGGYPGGGYPGAPGGYGRRPAAQGYAPRGYSRGQFLPPAYANGAVADPRQYHLRRPPKGYGWVTVGPNAYLTQRSTGLILDTAPLY